VATQLIDAIIGDDITLVDRSANVKIIDIKKDGSKVSIEADDLGEL
jgi:sRNA-binding carbon storage regulator CsrA